MKVLAIDCAAKTVSVALAQDGVLIAEGFYNTKQTHSETLLPLVGNILQNAGFTLKEVDALATSVGPGSFTGVRIGISAIKGLAFAEDKPVFGISALQLAALGSGVPNGTVLALTDARGGRYYAAFFEINGNAVTRLSEDEILTQEALEKAIGMHYNNKQIYLTGDGAVAFAKLSGCENRLVAPQFVLPHAGGLAVLASSGQLSNPTSPKALQPFYLLPSQAQRLRQQN